MTAPASSALTDSPWWRPPLGAECCRTAESPALAAADGCAKGGGQRGTWQWKAHRFAGFCWWKFNTAWTSLRFFLSAEKCASVEASNSTSIYISCFSGRYPFFLGVEIDTSMKMVEKCGDWHTPRRRTSLHVGTLTYQQDSTKGVQWI